MEWKTTWMRFLMLGIFSLFLIGFSCKKIEPDMDGEYVYINSTNHTISFLTPHVNSFKLLGLQTHLIKLYEIARKKTRPETYGTPFNNTDSEVIQFDGNKCLTMTSSNSSENSLLNISNYSVEKIDNRTYKFTYTFTEADYNRATTCP